MPGPPPGWRRFGPEIIANRQPGFDLREASVFARIPLHGSAAPIAAEPATGNVHRHRVPKTIARDRHLIHSDFVTIVDRRRSTRGKKEHCRDPRLLGTHSARNPRPVMISEHPIRPSPGGKACLVVVDQLRYRPGLPPRPQKTKIEGKCRPLRSRP
jgi:hypothetical protein